MSHPIEEFYCAKSKDLVRLCRIALHRRQIWEVDAEDIVQTVALKAWEKRDQLSHHPNLWGWSSNACMKECAMLRRNSIYRQKHLGWPVPLTVEMIEDETQDVILRWWSETENAELLQELTQVLTPLEQSVFDHYYVHEKSAKETAELLDIKVNAVNDAARRIRKRAAQIALWTFIFLSSPIFMFLCSLLSEGRLWS